MDTGVVERVACKTKLYCFVLHATRFLTGPLDSTSLSEPLSRSTSLSDKIIPIYLKINKYSHGVRLSVDQR